MTRRVTGEESRRARDHRRANGNNSSNNKRKPWALINGGARSEMFALSEIIMHSPSRTPRVAFPFAPVQSRPDDNDERSRKDPSTVRGVGRSGCVSRGRPRDANAPTPPKRARTDTHPHRSGTSGRALVRSSGSRHEKPRGVRIAVARVLPPHHEDGTNKRERHE